MHFSTDPSSKVHTFGIPLLKAEDVQFLKIMMVHVRLVCVIVACDNGTATHFSSSLDNTFGLEVSDFWPWNVEVLPPFYMYVF
jgi:hypothetical protein